MLEAHVGLEPTMDGVADRRLILLANEPLASHVGLEPAPSPLGRVCTSIVLLRDSQHRIVVPPAQSCRQSLATVTDEVYGETHYQAATLAFA